MVDMDKAADWLKSHGISERSFGRALRGFFKHQANRMASALSRYSVVTPAVVPAVFNVDAEHEEFMKLARRNLWFLMMQGADDALKPLRASKAIDDGPFYDEGSYFDEVPDDVRQAVLGHLREMSEQEYWRQIQEECYGDLVKVIEQAIADEVSPHALMKRIRLELGEQRGGKRAMRIARTETTGALNAGHVAAMDHLAAAGIINGKEWLAISDNDVRTTHLDLNGSTVAAGADFSVGGYEAPFPGHWSLPAGERVNCRCTVLSVLSV